MNAERDLTYAAVAAGLLFLAYVWHRGAGGVAQDVSHAAVSAAGGVVTGTVQGVGDTLGIPETDAQKCQAAIAAGDTWNASLYCPAGTFIKSIFTGGGSTAAASNWSATPTP